MQKLRKNHQCAKEHLCSLALAFVNTRVIIQSKYNKGDTNMSKDNTRRLIMYKTLLDQAVEKRKENISAKDLAEKLKVEPTSIYRLERGVNDIKLSTFIAYLDAFSYQIDIIPKTDSPEKGTDVDFVTAGEVPLDIEYFKTEPAALDRKQRLSLIKYLIDLEERSLGEDK